MFEHSVKVPRHFKIAANIVKKVSTEGGSVKSLLYDNKLRHFRTNVLYALITETIKHAADIDKMFDTCSLIDKESRLDPWLAKVLTTELLFGKKALPGKSKPEQTILSYKEQFEKYISEHQDDSKTEAVQRPRYVRINTNLLTTSDAIRAFQDEGYRFIRCTSGSYNDYLDQIKHLTEYDFTQDYHVKTVFVFSPGVKLHEHELYLENKIILQDKATTLAVHLLAPPAGSVLLDMCAAPGMKTTQAAAFMRNQGRIYAVERDEKRFQILCDFVERTGSKCVQTMNKDALAIKRGDLDDVEYILLDPSCSGSGMELSVHNYIDEARLARLTSLQEKFLKHAMNAFPKAKRIVYSTCSLFPEENERVVTNVVKTSRSKWRVQDVKELLKGQWNNIGSGMYGSMGARCMYARPDSDLTTGFFLAVLDRDQKDLEKSMDNEKCSDKHSENDNTAYNEVISDENRKRKSTKDKDANNDRTVEEITTIPKNKLYETQNDDTQEIHEEENIHKKKKKKKDKQKDHEESLETDPKSADNLVPELENNKKEKKKHKKQDNSFRNETMSIEENVEQNSDVQEPVRKKKKSKHKENCDDAESHLQEDCNVEGTNELPVKKKKKKRDKEIE